MGDFTARVLDEGRLFRSESDRRHSDGAPGDQMVVKHKPSGEETGALVHCAAAHEHEEQCAMDALKAMTVSLGMRPVLDGNGQPTLDGEGKPVMAEAFTSLWERAKAELLSRVAKKAAQTTVRVKPVPQKTVKGPDGKDKQVADLKPKDLD